MQQITAAERDTLPPPGRVRMPAAMRMFGSAIVSSADSPVAKQITAKHASLPRRSPATADGISSFRLSSWSKFSQFLDTQVFQSAAAAGGNYIWRGQRDARWSLSSSLDRLFETLGILKADSRTLEERSREHLEAFRYASRGRRGQMSRGPSLSENEWWALGQHYGLATPLLDWTRSPYAAAYFAFEERDGRKRASRVVYGLDQHAVLLKNSELANGPSYEAGRLPVVDFIDSLSDENPRLVSQGGLFTRAPIGTPIEQWVARAFEGSSSPVLVKIEIPNRERSDCLRSLSRMNINHLSLFPDLSGASRSTNLRLELDVR